MSNILINWVVSALVVIAVAYILPGVAVGSFFIALVVALVLGLVNAVLKPIAVILTLPLTILSLGLFIFVINAALVLLVATVVPGFQVTSFWWALIFSLILSLVNSFFKHQKKD